MNPEPPPFGDPTRVDRERSSAVGKGIFFGCGGCLALIALGMIVSAGIGYVFVSALRNSDACQETLRVAQASEIMKQELGEPMTLGWIISQNISISNGEGTAEASVPISGPRGDATVHTVATKKPDAPWVYSKMEATISKTGHKVNLR